MRKHRNLYVAIAAFLTYALAWLFFAAPIDQVYWNLRYFLTQRPASSSVAILSINPGEDQVDGGADDIARILATLHKGRPRHIYLDASLKRGSPALAAQLRSWEGRISIVARHNQVKNAWGDFEGSALEFPDPALAGNTEVVVSGFRTNFWKYVVTAPCAFTVEGKTYRSMAAAIAGLECQSGNIRPDFSINPATVETIDARRLIDGRVGPETFSGQVVVVSSAATSASGTLGYLGHRQQPLAMFDIAAADGAGSYPFIEWKVEVLVTIFTILVILAQRVGTPVRRRFVYALAASTAIFGPVVFEYFGRLVLPGSSIVIMIVFAAWRLWSRWRQRVIETGNSGLPNFVALGKQTIPLGFNLVVAVIGRYEEFLATLPTDLHGECARQIARRFSVGCRTGEIYHGEGGHFAWIEQDHGAEDQLEHFEGLRALFSAPLLVGGHMFDTNVHFGLDRNGQFDTLTRLNTALASASEALKHGRTIEQFEANRLANAPWELSLLARIDEGMRNGDIWLAYQPQWEYAESRISGAEALIRWNDPVRGAIRPDEFILQAERAGRIDALTYWVLEQAITSAEAMNTLGSPFQMSVNLSAQLVDKPSLISATAEIVRRRGIDCRLLTIEVTETASVYNRPAAIKNLQALRAMGFRLSIDDFGTGEASLCYLADLPSDELKLDRRFVSRIVSSERDRKIVQSTISLAHALDQIVVAEGIEDIATFDMLRRMGCDVGQGYYIGRPETFEQLRARYLSFGPDGGKAFTTC